MRTLPLLLLLSGCVTRGTHELVEVQLEATRTAMSSRTAQCQVELLEREDRLGAFAEANENQAIALAALTDRCAAIEDELELHRAEIADHVVAEGEVDAPTAEVREALTAHGRQRIEARAHAAFVTEVERRFDALVKQGQVAIVVGEDRVVVRILAIQLFNEGNVRVSPRGDLLIDAVAAALKDAPGWSARIEGHTETPPRHTAQHPSNWELGFDLALTTLRHLEELEIGLPMSVASFAGTEPIVDGPTGNQRVEIVLTPPVVDISKPVEGGPLPAPDPALQVPVPPTMGPGMPKVTPTPRPEPAPAPPPAPQMPR